jgi:plasmid stabilization system protein ParE
MKLVLSRNATEFLRHEKTYLDEVNPHAADAAIRGLRKALRFLRDQPRAGSPHPSLAGRRRFVAGPYVIDYRIDAQELHISHIRHGRQDQPEFEADDDLPV